MAIEVSGLQITLDATNDLSSDQYKIVKLDSSNAQQILKAGAGEAAVGVLQDKPSAGEPGSVMVSGVSRVVSDGTITAGDKIAADANAKATTATDATVDTSDTGAASDPVQGSNVLGIALNGSSSDGEEISVLITHGGAAPSTAQ